VGKHTFFVVVALSVVWIVLTETFNWQSLAIGLLVGAFCSFFATKFLPPAESANTVKFSKLIFYPFYVLGQVYKAAFSMLKFVFVGANVEFVPVKTTLKSETLRIILMDTMTFIPGSISMEINDDTIMSLWIYDKNLDISTLSQEQINQMTMGKIQKKLAKAQIEN